VESESKQLSPAHIEAVNRHWLTPNERASKVNTILRGAKITSWDVFCFAVEYIGMRSISIEDSELTEIAVVLNRWLYTIHYNHPARLYGQPDRKDVAVDLLKTLIGENHEPPTVHEEGKEVLSSNESGDVPRGTGSDEGDLKAQGPSGEPGKLHVVRGDQSE